MNIPVLTLARIEMLVADRQLLMMDALGKWHEVLNWVSRAALFA
ncbi:MAG: hypothetical protein AAGA01_15740 [Cyanobacteria bacterium P01_E01_bin.43]